MADRGRLVSEGPAGRRFSATQLRRAIAFSLLLSRLAVSCRARASVSDWPAVAAGTTLFLVPSDTPGFRVGKVFNKNGWRFYQNAELIFENARVAQTDMMGKLHGAMSHHGGKNAKFAELEYSANAVGVCDAAVEIGTTGQFSCPRCSMQRPQVCMKCSSAKFLTLKPGVSKLREEIAQAAGRKINEVVEVTGGGDDAVAIDQSKMLFIGTEAALHRVHEADTVVFLDIDQELAAPRYRASEIVGSLLVHAARLVGRSDMGGKVMVQTHSVDSPVLQAMATLHIDEYLQSVSEMRSFMKLPPFGALAQLSGTNIDEAINTLSKNVFVHVSASHDGSYLVKASDWQVLADALSEIEAAKGVRLKVQVDPSRV